MDSEILQALSRTTGPTCLVLLFCLWLLLRRTGRVSFWWMLVTWLLAWIIVPVTAYFGGMVIMFANIPVAWLQPEIAEPAFGVPTWHVISTAVFTAICWVVMTRWIGRDMRSRPFFTVTCVVALLTAAGPVATVGGIFLRAYGQAVQTACVCNLKEVGLAIQMYRDDHKGAFPERLQDLVEDYIKIDSVLRCPADNEFYFYVPPRSSDPPPERPIIVDPNHRYAHKGRILLILFADGSVRTFGADEPVLTQHHKKE